MPIPASRSDSRLVASLLLMSAALVVAGGAVHLYEWLETYRHVPGSVPGSAVVRIGFPVHVALSAVLAGALVTAAVARRRITSWVVAAGIAFQAGSLAALVASRTGSVLGWSEGGWSDGAVRTAVVEIAALVALVALTGVLALGRRRARPETDTEVAPRPARPLRAPARAS